MGIRGPHLTAHRIEREQLRGKHDTLSYSRSGSQLGGNDIQSSMVEYPKDHFTIKGQPHLSGMVSNPVLGMDITFIVPGPA